MAGNTILVVDGDLASRSYIAAALQNEGYNVLQAGSGKEGLVSAWRDRPDLIIVEPALPDLTGEDLAARLRSDARTSKVPLVGLSRDASAGRARSCRQAGFNEYIVKGPQALATLSAAIKTMLQGGVRAPKAGGLLVVFLSAKGGTGTSCLCANIARNIADQLPEARIAVADLVLPIGSVAGLVGYREDQNLSTVSSLPAETTTPDFLRQRLPMIEEWRFQLLAGSPDPQSGNDLQVGRIPELVSGLQAGFDFVLLDLGRALSRISMPLIDHADLVAMILGADLSTAMLSRTVWEYLKSKGVQASSMFPVLNRAVGLEGLTKAEVEQSVGIPIRTSIPYLGGNFSSANNQHQPYSAKFPRDTGAIVLKDTARQVIEAAQRARSG